MQRTDVIEKLKQAEPALRAAGVGALFLYGSYARDEAREDSDIDVFVDPAPTAAFDVLQSIKAYQMLQDAFPDKYVGYSTRDSIVPHYLPYIEQSSVQVF